MKTTTLTKVALRHNALFLDVDTAETRETREITPPLAAFLRRLADNGFCVGPELLQALKAAPVERLVEITEIINDVMGVNLNWAPLVKGWDTPTGESRLDHIITWVANVLGLESQIKGTKLPCGHFIPEGTFPLERYNGCPYCGKPFVTTNFVYTGQASRLKELRLFTLADMQALLLALLQSPVPLDASQQDSLELLLYALPLPANVDIPMKETAVRVVHMLAEYGREEEAAELLRTPADVLRYLWRLHTGHVQIIEPKTLIAHARKMYSHMWGPLDCGADAAKEMKRRLKLKYDRTMCRRIARWLNAVPMTAEQAAENMNSKRAMWVRMIRALRLGEYSRREGFEHLRDILDVFYKQNYVTWQGRVDAARRAGKVDELLALLQERPGAFARSLFATLLRFDSAKVLKAFDKIADKLPARLLISLGNVANAYFDAEAPRAVRPITGELKRIGPNKLLSLYSQSERKELASAVNALYASSMARRFAAQSGLAKTIYIDPQLYNIPVAVGDRAATIQDASCALMGTRFPVEGDSVRLFLQWGKGLPAQHLDMDISCQIVYPGKIEQCAYFNLVCTGAKHSGDIRSIPDMVGTAEYIELSLPELETAGAKYVTFTSNAYSCGGAFAQSCSGMDELRLSHDCVGNYRRGI